jgi:ParB-like chromosome segregation protein Spo0J
MAMQQKPGGKPPSAATATVPPAAKTSFKTNLKTVPLNQLIIRTEKFSFRAKEAFALEALRPLIESIRESGIKHQPEVYWDDDENGYVAVTGHRRLMSLQLLVDDGVFGFTADMPVQVRVLENTTYLDRLAWACADNGNLSAS